MSAASTDRRPSHELLMEAQEKLSQARDAETAAGNRGVAMILNDLTLAIFKVAIDDEIDEVANRAHDARHPGGAR